ncbi:uncharacterized protein IL334_006963 [Kwoniella shivajii]|uniref:G-protein coupled receptors family 1 profile domain-containing protein n=1 Tax=Kwoniella shivajii TaxID=564305 RepID=A0ABZ1DBC5_9TREE|nr:hypothetical protein IL334_006963 [Kwoniella shivajii]
MFDTLAVNSTFSGPASHYGLTNAVVKNAGIAANVAASLSLAMCLIVLGLTIWVYSYPTCRHILDRVSFRLLVVAMIWEFWYSFVFLCLYINDSIYRPDNSWGPRPCTAGVYFLVSSMHVVDLLIMFIAINLLLTINLGLNPLQLRLERWYIGISICIAYIAPLPSAALQHFGWDPALNTCWINGKGRKTRFNYLLEGIYITPIITCFVSTACVAIVLVTLFRQGRNTSRALFGGRRGKQKIDQDDKGSDQSDDVLFSSDPLTTGSDGLILSSSTTQANANNTEIISQSALDGIIIAHLPKRKETEKEKRKVKCKETEFCEKIGNFIRRKGWYTTEEIHNRKSQSYFNSLSDKFFGIAIRISWYPVTLLFINTILIVGDLLIAAQGGVKSHHTVWLYCLYYFLYGGRGLCCSGLVIIIDPSLIRGIKAAWKERKASRHSLPTTATQNNTKSIFPLDVSLLSTTFESGSGFTPDRTDHRLTPTQIHPQLNSVSRLRMDSDISFDFATALAFIPGEDNRDKEKSRQQHERDQLQPTVELDLSYLDQELDMTVLDDEYNKEESELPITEEYRSENPTSSPRTPELNATIARSDSTGRTGILGHLVAPTYNTNNENPIVKKALKLKASDTETEKRKEEKRKRDEKVREIKKRFEEVQSHL